MTALANVHLVLFFTRGVSLKVWDDAGILEREVALYRALQPHLGGITFITYGDSSDLKYVRQLDGIRILCNCWGLSPWCYERWLLWLHIPHLLRVTVFKTNQVQGGDRALRAAQRLGKKLVARCGYLLSFNEAQKYDRNSLQAQSARTQEARLFTGADRVVVTTPAMRQTVIEHYRLPEGKVTVIPNYVDTGLFAPNLNGASRPDRICFIGRLEEEKNLFALLEAVRGLDLELLMIGNGGLLDDLATWVEAENIRVQFLGNLPNTALPQHLNSSGLFILPSLYEGHPKALLEAMACGLPVIGTDVPGIRELISHRETGYLCGASPDELRVAILEVLGNADLRTRMGRNAREFIVGNFALEQVIEMELALLSSMV